ATAAGIARDFAKRKCSWLKACDWAHPSERSPRTLCEATSGTQSQERKCPCPANECQSASPLVSEKRTAFFVVRPCMRKRLCVASNVGGYFVGRRFVPHFCISRAVKKSASASRRSTRAESQGMRLSRDSSSVSRT